MSIINYEYVKKRVEEKSGGRSHLLNPKDDIFDYNSTLTLTCECGNSFQTKYSSLSYIAFQCKECRDKKASQRYRMDFEDVKDYIKSKGCEYISGDYINNKSILTLRCPCGNIFEKRFTYFKNSGQTQCQSCGKESSRQSKFKYDLQSAKKILANKNYTLLEDKYIDCQTNMKCLCPNGHIVQIKLIHFLYGKSGCKICAIENQRGENHWNYKGGESEVLDDLRKSIKQWKIDVAKEYGYKCYLTDTKKDCVVHHLYPFKQIVEDSCKELNLPLHRHFGDYTSSEFQSLKDLVISKNTIDIGILLQRKVHKKFHSIYGIRHNTIEQFNEFIEKFYPHKQKINTNCEKD